MRRRSAQALRMKSACCGDRQAEEVRSCAPMIRRPAPAVKPTMTVCEMKLTSAPSRASPSAELDQADHQVQRQHERRRSRRERAAPARRPSRTPSATSRWSGPRPGATTSPTARRRSPAASRRRGRTPAASRRASRTRRPAAARRSAPTSPASRSARSVVARDAVAPREERKQRACASEWAANGTPGSIGSANAYRVEHGRAVTADAARSSASQLRAPESGERTRCGRGSASRRRRARPAAAASLAAALRLAARIQRAPRARRRPSATSIESLRGGQRRSAPCAPSTMPAASPRVTPVSVRSTISAASIVGAISTSACPATRRAPMLARAASAESAAVGGQRAVDDRAAEHALRRHRLQRRARRSSTETPVDATSIAASSATCGARDAQRHARARSCSARCRAWRRDWASTLSWASASSSPRSCPAGRGSTRATAGVSVRSPESGAATGAAGLDAQAALDQRRDACRRAPAHGHARAAARGSSGGVDDRQAADVEPGLQRDVANPRFRARPAPARGSRRTRRTARAAASRRRRDRRWRRPAADLSGPARRASGSAGCRLTVERRKPPARCQRPPPECDWPMPCADRREAVRRASCDPVHDAQTLPFHGTSQALDVAHQQVEQ